MAPGASRLSHLARHRAPPGGGEDPAAADAAGAQRAQRAQAAAAAAGHGASQVGGSKVEDVISEVCHFCKIMYNIVMQCYAYYIT